MGNVVRALHTRTYIIGKGSNKNASAKGAAAYRSASITAAAAYRSNDKIKSEIDGKIHDYSRKRGVVFSKIFLPQKAPKEFADRSTLWNTVERVENRKNSRYARQWEASFPSEFSEADRLELLTNFVEDYFVSQGMIADVAIHDVADRQGGRNIHTHVLLTLRRVDEKGFTGNKVREWNSFRTQYNLPQIWRVAWADRCNEIYKKMDLPTRIDPRSYEIQGNGLEPTKPIGKYANQLEKRGIETEAGNKNRQIMARNQQRIQNSVYDLVAESVLNTVEHSKRRVLIVDERMRKAEMRKAKNEIRKGKGIIQDLEEMKNIIGKMERLANFYHETGDEVSKAGVEQSIDEARANLNEKYGITPVQIESLLNEHREILAYSEQYLADLPDIENNPSYEVVREKEPERNIENDADREFEPEI